jgi:hypothetical protein
MTIDGDTWDIVSDLAYSCVSLTRETLKGQTAVEGYSEMPTQQFISCTLRDRGDHAIKNFNGMTNTTVICTLANGKQVYGANMWCTEVGEVRTQEGTFTIRFEGTQVTEETVG